MEIQNPLVKVNIQKKLKKKKPPEYFNIGFPAGPVVKNLPANAGFNSSTPGSGRYYMLGTLRPYAATSEPRCFSPLKFMCLEPVLCNK